MNSNAGRIFWGVVLILIGGYFLAEIFGVAPELSDVGWVVIMAILSIGFFTLYFAGGMRDWGMLFPSFILAGAAAAVWISTRYEEMGTLAGVIMMWSIALPFWAAWLSNRTSNWWATIPAWAMTALGVIIFFEEFLGSEMTGALVLWSIGLPFLVVYLRDRTHWWALIPAYAMGVIGAVVLFEEMLGGEFVGALILFAIALPFLVVYTRDRAHWWPLIPAGVLGMSGAIVLLEAVNTADEAIGGVFLAGLAVIFLLIFALYPKNWWAIIPGGILLSLSATVFLSVLPLEQTWDGRLLELVSYGGMAVTFGILWLMRARWSTGWAKYPAVGLAAYAVIAAVFGSEVIWPFVLIAVGVWILLRGRSSLIDEVEGE